MIRYKVITVNEKPLDLDKCKAENLLPLEIIRKKPFFMSYQMTYKVISKTEHSIIYYPIGSTKNELLSYTFNPMITQAEEIVEYVETEFKKYCVVPSDDLSYYKFIEESSILDEQDIPYTKEEPKPEPKVTIAEQGTNVTNSSSSSSTVLKSETDIPIQTPTARTPSDEENELMGSEDKPTDTFISFNQGNSTTSNNNTTDIFSSTSRHDIMEVYGNEDN